MTSPSRDQTTSGGTWAVCSAAASTLRIERFYRLPVRPYKSMPSSLTLIRAIAPATAAAADPSRIHPDVYMRQSGALRRRFVYGHGIVILGGTISGKIEIANTSKSAVAA